MYRGRSSRRPQTPRNCLPCLRREARTGILPPQVSQEYLEVFLIITVCLCMYDYTCTCTSVICIIGTIFNACNEKCIFLNISFDNKPDKTLIFTVYLIFTCNVFLNTRFLNYLNLYNYALFLWKIRSVKNYASNDSFNRNER